MFFADGGLVPSDRFIGTRVEAELAFIMKQRLAEPHCTLFDVLNATDFVVPALEILDTRIERVDPVTKSTRHPATGVAWLANKIAAHGLALEPGQVVLAGSFIRPIETRKGGTIQADYGPCGSVSCYFA
jgi:2-oxo-hept-3-ene-1,7-dioate hydratase